MTPIVQVGIKDQNSLNKFWYTLDNAKFGIVLKVMNEILAEPYRKQHGTFRWLFLGALTVVPVLAGCDEGSPRPGFQQETTTAPDSAANPGLRVFLGCEGERRVLFNAGDRTAYTDQGTIEPRYVRVLPDLNPDNNVVAVYAEPAKTVVQGIINLDNITCGN